MDLKELLRKLEEWLTGKNKHHMAVDVDLDPVLLVPGIGGSILQAVTEKGGNDHVWVRLFNANSEFKEKLWSLFNPSTGKTESLCPDTTIHVPDDRHGLYSCDILDPGLLIRLEAVYYFHDLIQKMLEWGYVEGSSLFGFGYDFRQSNRLSETMDGLKSKLETIYKKSGGKKVNVVSHSMGGLVIKSFMVLHGETFEKCVNSWIAIAAPFQGAPGFVTDCLLTGVEFVKGWQKDLFVAKWSTHQLLIECPSVYELMSSLQHNWETPPQLQVWRKNVDTDGEMSVKLESFTAEGAISVMKAALTENTLIYGGQTIPLPFNSSIFEWSKETRKLWEAATMPEGVQFYNLYGTSIKTPLVVRYGSEKLPIEDLQEILDTEAEFECVDGDGTVPLESAKADQLNAVERVGVAGEHRGLLSNERVFRILKHWLKAGKPDPFYDPVNDYVMLPTMAEFEEFREEHISFSRKQKVHVPSLPAQQDVASCGSSKDEYVTALISGFGSNPDAQAEAHSHVEPHTGTPEDMYFEVSTHGVAEGKDAKRTALILEQAMASASQKAVVSNS